MMKNDGQMGMEDKGGSGLKLYGWMGLAVMAIAEVLLFAVVPFVRTFFTPLAWSGYILFADALVFRQKGNSLIMSRPREFLFLLPLSIGFWLIFEFYNLYLRNWHYVGLPEELPLRLFGYAWAFATIWPAILETAELLEGWKKISRRKVRPWRIRKKHLGISLFFGSFCLALPFLTPLSVTHYLAAPVWLGFIFLLDPLNYWMGRDSLLLDLERGDPRKLYSLLLSGFLCGFLWEFWNYWAGGRWHYTVPIMGHIKIFEMPVLGYLGFPPFAVECFTLWACVKNGFRRARGSHG